MDENEKLQKLVEDSCTIGEARDICLKHGISVTTATIRNWIGRYYGLGRKIGGRYVVSKKKLTEVLYGENH